MSRPDLAAPEPLDGTRGTTKQRKPIAAPLLILGLVVVALNLRPPIAGFGPLLSQIQAELGVSAATLSLLTTLPLLCWGVLAPLAPLLSRRYSNETIILWSTAVIGLGSVLRLGATLPIILTGTVLVGAGIALNNVLLPSLIRRDYPTRVGLMTGLYTLAVVGGAALASGVAVPLMTALGGAWRSSVGVWIGLAVLGVLAWLPTVSGRQTHARAPAKEGPSVWRNPYALSVTLYMGFQSLVFFTWLTWLPKVLQDEGFTAAQAGLLLAFANVVQLPFTLAVPVLAARPRLLVPLAVGTALLSGAGIAGLLLSPLTPLPWLFMMGAGAGSMFPLALMFIAVRAAHVAQVPQLSAMAQGFGYALAASGPFIFGALHDWTGDWQVPLLFLLVMTAVVLVTGVAAGRGNRPGT
ncbi:CynX/NimT family MFS transporter [Deinococcus humi]|uniref:CP family cyanate transporter-like MFS transporter n=1 Tax=Deinococcus humi TaxID=662880 RepID=A0A7W8JUS3_9DEIO|nr:MFS transporter [Deinococcus humi]MBB5363203.1 CP family cyanate transporter-like MFS transporter [Deinococcus humi]GGO27701.1 MFS transporter [Deinococcus humi]